jgi:hypothetical protein
MGIFLNTEINGNLKSEINQQWLSLGIWGGEKKGRGKKQTNDFIIYVELLLDFNYKQILQLPKITPNLTIAPRPKKKCIYYTQLTEHLSLAWPSLHMLSSLTLVSIWAKLSNIKPTL